MTACNRRGYRVCASQVNGRGANNVRCVEFANKFAELTRSVGSIRYTSNDTDRQRQRSGGGRTVNSYSGITCGGRTGVLHQSNVVTNYGLRVESKTGELALLLIRVYRSLFALFGGNLADMQHFLRTDNRHLDAPPLALMMQVQGLVRVVEYLDAIRGKG